MYLISLIMVRKPLSESQRWHIIGMRSAGISFQSNGRQMVNHITVSCLRYNTPKPTQWNIGRPQVASQREDSALHLLVRRIPFTYGHVLKRQWLPNNVMSVQVVGNRLKSARLKWRRVIKGPWYQMDINNYVWHGVYPDVVWIWRHGVGSIARMRAVFCFIYPMDEWEFGEGNIRVIPPRNIQRTVRPLRSMHSNGMGCICHDCKLDLVIIRGNFTKWSVHHNYSQLF